MPIIDYIEVTMIMVGKWRAIDKTSGLSVDGKTKENAVGELIIKLGVKEQVKKELIQIAKTPEQEKIITGYVNLVSRFEKIIEAHKAVL